MKKIDDAKMYVKIVDTEIIAYDYISDSDEVDFNTAGVLTELDNALADRVQSVLLIESVEDYGIKILNKKN